MAGPIGIIVALFISLFMTIYKLFPDEWKGHKNIWFQESPAPAASDPIAIEKVDRRPMPVIIPGDLHQPLKIDSNVVERVKKFQKHNIIPSKVHILKDVSQFTIQKKGVRPHQFSSTLKSYLDMFKDDTKYYNDTKAIIDEIDNAKDVDDLRGKSGIQRGTCMQSTGELSTTFIIYQFRRDPDDNKVVVDALLLTASQKLSFDWKALGCEAAVAFVPFIFNPCAGLAEMVAILAGGTYAAINYHKSSSVFIPENAEALLYKMLLDKKLIIINEADNNVYLTLD